MGGRLPRGDKAHNELRSKRSRIIPTFGWYSGESRKLGLPPRCPIAHAELCPRYWQSLDALGRNRGITTIPAEQNESLQHKWKSFSAVIAEEEPIADEHSVTHFCPEVTYDIFGYFASFLHEYVDDTDREIVWRIHERDGTTDQVDPTWQYISPLHYTECREYSIHATFATGKPSKPPRPGEVSPKRRWAVLARDSFTCVYCGRKPSKDSPDVVLHVDHKVSIKDGGTDEMENLVTACDNCNAGKGASSLRDGG
jgi:5-methylcytosine-specific restriction endonuclease McrA